MRVNKTQRNYIIVFLCVMLLIMGVGYAAFNSQLKISGTSNVTSSFVVKITNIQSKNVVGGASNKEIPTFSDDSATFSTSLTSPGDSITYDVTVENQGTIDAVLKTISKTDASNSAILFETSGLDEGQVLNHGETATMTVKVSYNSAFEDQPDNLESTLKITLDFEQKGSSEVTPSVAISSDDLKAKAVTTGDGIYADEYESGRYVYKGANPNNYITFSGQEWRILSVEDDGMLKLVKNGYVGDRVFDGTSSNNWSRPADINTYLNGEYLESLSDKDKIVAHNWNIGSVVNNNSDLAGQITDESSVTSNDKVGMITASEYIRSNSNISQCGNFSAVGKYYCSSTTYMQSYISYYGYLWTISPVKDTTDSMVVVTRSNSLSSYAVNKKASYVPAIYLSSSTMLTGEGTKDNPYVIE